MVFFTLNTRIITWYHRIITVLGPKNWKFVFSFSFWSDLVTFGFYSSRSKHVNVLVKKLEKIRSIKKARNIHRRQTRIDWSHFKLDPLRRIQQTGCNTNDPNPWNTYMPQNLKYPQNLVFYYVVLFGSLHACSPSFDRTSDTIKNFKLTLKSIKKKVYINSKFDIIQLFDKNITINT